MPGRLQRKSRKLTPDSVSDLAQIGKTEAIVRMAVICYIFPLHIYFNFSGYCDIVIGAAALLGIRLPENFSYPFFSRNMIEYWTRWHMTLGFWIRDYLFSPLYKSLVEQWPQSFRSLAVLSYFIAFFLNGLWHGSSWNFVVFGLINGVGVSAAKLWETVLISRIGRSGLRTYLQRPWIRRAAIFATFHYVCFATYFFNTDLARSTLVARNAAWRIFH